jgi:hypothetical protein
MKVSDLIKELEPYKNDYLLLSVSNENFLTDVQKYSKYRRCAKKGNSELHLIHLVLEIRNDFARNKE